MAGAAAPLSNRWTVRRVHVCAVGILIFFISGLRVGQADGDSYSEDNSMVVQLDGETHFSSIVGGKSHVMVEFYAPWCQHSQKVAPEYEIVGRSYSADHDRVIIAKVDGQAQKRLALSHKVRGFPYFLWFSAGSSDGLEYSGPRDAESMVSFINGRAGLRNLVRKLPSNVITLTDSSFKSVVLNPHKSIMVLFFAPWCRHCKELKPVYEQLGRAFIGEENVVIARIDADKYRETGAQYSVSGYPTLRFFGSNDDKFGIQYLQDFSVSSFVTYINNKAGTQRHTNGTLYHEVGRIPKLDKIAASFIAVGSESGESSNAWFDRVNELITKAEIILSGLTGVDKESGIHYVKAMKRARGRGMEYFENEMVRLKSLLAEEYISGEKRVSFNKRLNILHAFRKNEL